MRTRRLLAVLAAFFLMPALLAEDASGTVLDREFDSKALGETLRYRVYLPAGHTDGASRRYTTLYLLHGRGDKMTAWDHIIPDLDRLIREKRIPPVIAIMPDATASRRASFYIDSQFKGSGEMPAGRRVETALTRDLVVHVDQTYPTASNRLGRVVAGYSMGGYGAMRYALAHPDLFGAAVVLSPAVFVPTSPSGSSTRTFGAFGRDSALFDEEIYRQKNYPALIPEFEARALPLFMYIGVGDDEAPVPPPTASTHDLDYEAHTLYNRMRRVRGVRSELRVVNGRHDWDAWRPTFVEGVELAFRFLSHEGAGAEKR